MQKERKDKHFIKKPIYEGGPKALKTFISQNLRYPKAAFDNKIEGTVVIRYDINHKGKVTDTKIISSVGHGCDEEATRLVKLLEFTVPKTRKTRVTFHKTLQIHFRLPKEAPTKKVEATPTPTSFQYTITTEKSKTDKTPAKKSNTYSYTIRF